MRFLQDSSGNVVMLQRIWRVGKSHVVTLPAAVLVVAEEDVEGYRWVELEEVENGLLLKPVSGERLSELAL